MCGALTEELDDRRYCHWFVGKRGQRSTGRSAHAEVSCSARSFPWITWRKQSLKSSDLRQTGAIAVEMEAAAVLERAQQVGGAVLLYSGGVGYG